jgi:hypothetical protein
MTSCGRLRARQHTSLECIPLPVDLVSSLPMYLRKAILESGEMWATNPKLVESFGKRVHNVSFSCCLLLSLTTVEAFAIRAKNHF